uniref:(California timema) hypothetical protein n=1 Tax=Timema californicum TaxID=61474 RepID=A0A7R9J299_TIMCA|nr:unnamed protein product [Timema californicum]
MRVLRIPRSPIAGLQEETATPRLPWETVISALSCVVLQGDGNIRYYEVADQAPWLHYLNQFLSGSPQQLSVSAKEAMGLL